MKTIHKIRIDMVRKGIPPMVNIMQGDSARLLEVSLYENNVPWDIPSGASVYIAFRSSAGKNFRVTSLANGTPVATYTGNVAMIFLPMELTANCGDLPVVLVFLDGSGKQIATFPVSVCVSRNPAADAEVAKPVSPDEFTQLLQAITVERARINNLTTLKEGSTTGDAELQDIRVGYDGKVYETAGEAVRGQIDGLGFDFEAVDGEFTPIDILDGLTLTRTVGASWGGSGTITSNNYTVTYTAINEKIDVLPGHTYVIKNFRGVLRLFYQDGTVGEQVDFANDNTVKDREYIVPEGVAQVGVAYLHDSCNFTEMYRMTPTADEQRSFLLKNDKFVVTPENLQDKETQEFIKAMVGNEAVSFQPDASTFAPPNILEGLTLTRTVGASWGGSGTITSNNYTVTYTAINEKIDVLPGHTYVIKNFSGVLRPFYQDGAVGEQVDFANDNTVKDREYIVPEGVAQVGVAYLHDSCNFTEMYRMTPTAEEAKSFPIKNDNLSISPENLKSNSIVSLLAPLRGKVIVNFGDSIFGNARPPEDVSTRLAELTGAMVHNCGFGGCRMSEHPTEGFDAFSMYRLADAITSGSFTLQDAALASGGVPAYFSETVTLLKSIDFNNVDIITIAYGTNDWGGYNKSGKINLTMPENPMDTAYFAGAMRYSIETILAAFPHIRIFICCPTYRANLDAANNFVEDTDTWVRANHKLSDCIEQEREIAEEYKLPFIDNYNIGINKANRLYYFPVNDGAHHNINGRRLIAAHIAKELF